MSQRQVRIGGVPIGGGAPPAVIAGPCVLESEALALECARAVKEAARAAGMGAVFKGSYDKANRSSGASYRGPGLEEGLRILAAVRGATGLPVLSDVHTIGEAAQAAQVLDALQIPAFLCRQTDLLQAAGRTGRPVNVKKGQFLAPQDMRHAAAKLEEAGCAQILLTERGASFGYHNLVADMRSLVLMREAGWPVVFDATHSVQAPGGLGDRSGGDRRMVAPLARAAAAVGVDAFFLECHPRPDEALSDGPNMIPLQDLRPLLETLAALDGVRRRAKAGEGA
ncbi:MAG: 3-deoxy-8-phosphooctulonate synthase [Candidatus Tectomicrobia bacterium]|nr:3-deoxy-8-phosphooctulonate synthase [Candidatus Tectomicrobia bacterium]